MLVAGAGAAERAALPELPGLDGFAGTTFHSARWDHGHDLRRRARRGDRHRRVGDPVRPARSSRDVARLHVFQRTAPWVLPHTDRADPAARAARSTAASRPLQRAVRAGVYAGRELLVLGFVAAPAAA